MDQHELRSLYLSGLSMRQIGAKLGFSHFKVWWHMRKLRGHANTVTKILVKRVITAERLYSVTRTPARRRRLKHSLAMLRQKRPDLYAAAIERGRPKSCEGCARPTQATLARTMWSWECSHCGARDMRKAESVAVLLARRCTAQEAKKP